MDWSGETSFLQADQPSETGIQVRSFGDVIADGDRATSEKMDFNSEMTNLVVWYVFILGL